MNVTYRTQTASAEEIHEHLVACDRFFVPPLSSRVDLWVYARKMLERAVSFEAWCASTLVGICNAYLNDPERHMGFITNVSVLRSYSGQGIASTLVRMCLDRARADGFSKLWLQVSPCNQAAVAVYAKAGFRIVASTRHSISMECEIREPSREEQP